MRLCPVFALVLSLLMSALLMGGCSAQNYRERRDQAARSIIEQKQQQATGRTEPFTIERPADTLRRRLLLDQELPHSSPASLARAICRLSSTGQRTITSRRRRSRPIRPSLAWTGRRCG